MGILLTYIVTSLALPAVFNQLINQNNNLNNKSNFTSISNGGLGDFPIGPTNINASGIEQSFEFIVIPGQATTIYLTIGLLNNDYNIYPLVGFNYSYTASEVPDWIDFGEQSKIITASPPKNWKGSVTFNVTYSDFRSNTSKVTLPFVFTYGINQNKNRVAFTCVDPSNKASDTYTAIFPLFTTINGNNQQSIKINNYGILTDIGIFPWTNLQPVIKQNNVQNNIILNNQLYNTQTVNSSKQTRQQNSILQLPTLVSYNNSNQLINSTSNLSQQQGIINTTTITLTPNIPLVNENILPIPLPQQVLNTSSNQSVAPHPSTLNIIRSPTTQTVNTINGRTIIRLQNQILVSGNQQQVDNYFSNKLNI